jgi:predicted HAD superfamily Cof-like phosphohydrolase
VFSNFQKVLAFHKKFELPRPLWPQTPYRGMLLSDELDVIYKLKEVEQFIRNRRTDDDVAWGRVQMMLEELREYAEAVYFGDVEKQADSLVDLEYFAHGTAVTSGFPQDEIFDEVHRANMEKERVVNAEESFRLNKLDVKKPEGWQPPDVAGILDRRRSTARSIAGSDFAAVFS